MQNQAGNEARVFNYSTRTSLFANATSTLERWFRFFWSKIHSFVLYTYLEKQWAENLHRVRIEDPNLGPQEGKNFNVCNKHNFRNKESSHSRHKHEEKNERSKKYNNIKVCLLLLLNVYFLGNGRS